MSRRAPILGITGLVLILFALLERWMTHVPGASLFSFGWFGLLHLAAGGACLAWYFVAGGGSLAAARVRQGTCVFRIDGTLQPFDTVYYNRQALPMDKTFDGPAVVLQRDATTVVPPGWNATTESGGNIILRQKG